MESNKRRKMGQNYLTEDLITDIISRVSPKNLLRFKCVSKSWCSLIRTDPFLLRLQRTVLLPYRPCLFIEECIKPTFGTCLFYHYWIYLDSVEDQNINLVELQNPLDQCPRQDTSVIASCHDLLVLRVQRSNKFVVCNPITGKHVMVPPNPAGDDNVFFFGFGYDRVHGCYKLITRVGHHHQTLELMVYDLDKGTWKRLQFGMGWKSQFECYELDHLYLNWHFRTAKCVDGALYWWFSMKIPGKKNMLGKTSMLVCFFLAEEEFHVAKTPDLGHVTKYHPNSLTIFEGKLGMACQGLSARHEFLSIDMDDDDDEGKRQWRWTKLLAISAVPPYLNADDFLMPVCFSACKNKILILSRMKNQLFWYDIVKKKFNKLNNNFSGRCQDDKLFWYDMVKEEVHKPNNPIHGRRFTRTRIKIL